MAIKWVGIVEDVKKFQTDELNSKMKKIEMPNSLIEMQMKGIPFMIPSLIIIFLSMVYKARLYGGFVSEPTYIFIGFVIGLVLLVVHELLHAIVYPKEAIVSIGIIPEQLAAVALASYPLSKGRFILMSLLPYILGILPLVGFLFSPLDNSLLNGILFGAMCFGLISPYTDLYNVFMVMKDAPTNAMIQFIDDELYWFYK